MSGVTMNFENYYQAIKSMPKPVMPSELPKVFIDINGLIRYAQENNTSPDKMSDAEKSLFIRGDYKSFYNKSGNIEHTQALGI